MGSAVQNVFTSAKVLALAAVVMVGLVAKNAAAIAANFGAGWHNFWAGAGWGTLHAVQVGVGGPTALVGCADDGGGGAGGVVVQLGCVEQRDVYGGRDSESESGIFRCRWRSGPVWCCCCMCSATLFI